MSRSCSFRLMGKRRQVEILLGLADPASDRNVAIHLKSALMRHARVRGERDVCEREGVACEIAAAPELALQMIERGNAALDLLRIKLGNLLAEIDHVEAADG